MKHPKPGHVPSSAFQAGLVALLFILVFLLGAGIMAVHGRRPVVVLTPLIELPAPEWHPAQAGDPDTSRFLAQLTVEDLDRGLAALASEQPEGVPAEIGCLVLELLDHEREMFALRERAHLLRIRLMRTGVQLLERLPPPVAEELHTPADNIAEPGGISVTAP